MKFLLFLLLVMFQDPAPGGARAGARPSTVENLIEDLDNNDPVVRDSATSRLIEREASLEMYKAIFNNTVNPEVKWRLNKVIKSIEDIQTFRSHTTLSPLITLKFEGTADKLFEKLAEITKQKFDPRAFGGHDIAIDVTDTPLLKVLDIVSKQTGFKWVVGYYDSKGERINDYNTNLEVGLSSPVVNYTTAVELNGSIGMSSNTPSFTGAGFKVQVGQTNFGICNQFGTVVTELALQLNYAVEPSFKFSSGPKIKYTKITNDQNVVLENHSQSAKVLLVAAPPTSKSVSIAGTARYRIPLKVETIVLTGLENLKSDNPDMGFLKYPNIRAKFENGRIQIHDDGFSSKFTGNFSVKSAANAEILCHRPGQTGNSGNGYVSSYEDYIEFYIYNNVLGSVNTIEFEYVSEYKDYTFDFTIDNIPLY